MEHGAPISRCVSVVLPLRSHAPSLSPSFSQRVLSRSLSLVTTHHRIRRTAGRVSAHIPGGEAEHRQHGEAEQRTTENAGNGATIKANRRRRTTSRSRSDGPTEREKRLHHPRAQKMALHWHAAAAATAARSYARSLESRIHSHSHSLRRSAGAAAQLYRTPPSGAAVL